MPELLTARDPIRPDPDRASGDDAGGGHDDPGVGSTALDLCCLAVGVMVLAWTHAVDPDAGAIAAVPVVGIAVVYVIFGRPQLRLPRGERRGTPAAVAMLVLFAVAVTLSLRNAFLLFPLFPLLFRIQRLWPAIVTLVVANVLPLLITVTVEGWRSPVVAFLAARSTVGIPIIIGLSYWFDRVIRQSQERVRLIAALEQSQAEIARISRHAGTMAERTRLVGEIHDTLAQGFTSIITLLQAARADLPPGSESARTRVDMAVRTARENLAESRAMILALTPPVLDDTDLADALRRQTDALTAQTGLTAGTEVSGAIRALPTAVEVVLLRATQEALANVRRHADAHEVRVRLRYTPAAVRLEIRDDGRGFDPAGPRAGYGLTGMRVRVEKIDGTFTVGSTPGHGTTVEVEIPA